MDNVIIRPAVEADAEAIGRLWENLVAYHQALDAALPAAVTDGHKVYARRVVDRLYDTHTRILVAVDGDRLIGYVLGVIVDLVPEMFAPEEGGFLADIFVDESYRGRGIGRKLVNTLAEWLRSRGISYLEWYVAARNDSGRSFWQSIGGREIMIRMRVELKRTDND